MEEKEKKFIVSLILLFFFFYLLFFFVDSYKSPKTKTPLKRKGNSSGGQSTTTPNKLENEIDNETKSPMRKKISKKLMGSPEDSKNYSDDSKTVNLVESKMASELKIPTKDDLFREFRRICANVAEVDAYKEKTAILRNMFIHGSSGGKYIYIYFFYPCKNKK